MTRNKYAPEMPPRLTRMPQERFSHPDTGKIPSGTFDAEKHRYFKNGIRIPSVTQVLVDEGFIDTYWFTAEARNRGTDIHRRIKEHQLEKMLGVMGCRDWNGVTDAFFEGYRAFERDCNWAPFAWEQPLFGDLYAGTPDQIGMMNHIEAVVDFKSGGICPATGLQLAGYEDLYGKPLKRFALQLTKEGKYKLTEYKDKGDKYIFKSAVAIWWYKQNNRIRG